MGSRVVQLYCSTDDDFCVKLIQIIVQIPLLKDRVRCIDVDRVAVKKEIDSIPTIDDGSVNVNEWPVYHKHDEAFAWVVNQCYKMQQQGQMSPEAVAQVEMQVTEALQEFYASPESSSASSKDDTPPRSGSQHVNPVVQPPPPIPASVQAILMPPSTAVYQTVAEDEGQHPSVNTEQQRTKYLYRQYLDEHKKRPKPTGSMADRMKQLEQEREMMLSTLKADWDRTGGAAAAQQNAPTSRSDLRNSEKSNQTVTEARMKDYEYQRQQMLQDLVAANSQPQPGIPLTNRPPEPRARYNPPPGQTSSTTGSGRLAFARA